MALTSRSGMMAGLMSVLPVDVELSSFNLIRVPLRQEGILSPAGLADKAV